MPSDSGAGPHDRRWNSSRSRNAPEPQCPASRCGYGIATRAGETLTPSSVPRAYARWRGWPSPGQGASSNSSLVSLGRVVHGERAGAGALGAAVLDQLDLALHDHQPRALVDLMLAQRLARG